MSSELDSQSQELYINVEIIMSYFQIFIIVCREAVVSEPDTFVYELAGLPDLTSSHLVLGYSHTHLRPYFDPRSMGRGDSIYSPSIHTSALNPE